MLQKVPQLLSRAACLLTHHGHGPYSPIVPADLPLRPELLRGTGCQRDSALCILTAPPPGVMCSVRCSAYLKKELSRIVAASPGGGRGKVCLTVGLGFPSQLLAILSSLYFMAVCICVSVQVQILKFRGQSQKYGGPVGDNET